MLFIRHAGLVVFSEDKAHPLPPTSSFFLLISSPPQPRTKKDGRSRSPCRLVYEPNDKTMVYMHMSARII